jgi:predicted nucleic acid-binding protein
VIVADTGAILALIDADDLHHLALRALYEEEPDAWILPWAVLPEIDYLLATQLGPKAERLFVADLAAGTYRVEWGQDKDFQRAHEISTRYQALKLVDASVIAVAERLGAFAIATLDLRHFGSVAIKGQPRLIPRDL